MDSSEMQSKGNFIRCARDKSNQRNNGMIIIQPNSSAAQVLSLKFCIYINTPSRSVLRRNKPVFKGLREIFLLSHNTLSVHETRSDTVLRPYPTFMKNDSSLRDNLLQLQKKCCTASTDWSIFFLIQQMPVCPRQQQQISLCCINSRAVPKPNYMSFESATACVNS